MMDWIGTLFSFIITVITISLIIGDHTLLRCGLSIFVGISVAFGIMLVYTYGIEYQVINPLIHTEYPLQEGLLSGLSIVFGFFLLVKFLFNKSSTFLKIGKPILAMITGVGVATAIGGAVTGTLIPQILAAVYSFPSWQSSTQLASAPTLMTKSILESVIILVGMISVIVSFQVHRSHLVAKHIFFYRVISGISKMGRIFIAVAFGTIYAGVFLSAFAALVERIQAVWTFLFTL